MSAVALAPPQTRGRPLLLIAILMFAWAACRALLWQPGPVGALPAFPDFSWPTQLSFPQAPAALQDPAAFWVREGGQRPDTATPHVPWRDGAVLRMRMPPAVQVGQLPGPATENAATQLAPAPVRFEAPGSSRPRLHSALAEPERYLVQAEPVPRNVSAPQGRFSGDAWVLLRREEQAGEYSAAPSYGRSQAGAVVRYRLDPASGHRPEAYVRVSSALGDVDEREAVAGLSARPLADFPLRLAAELRVSESSAGRELRPAVMAVTELPPLYLPFDLRAESYLQGGYVAGDYATAFIDGQARLDRTFLRLDDFRLSAGGGLWGGAQRGSSRLDVGPTAGLDFRLGGLRGRLSADYRFRVAGAAAPQSGPALTLSAGF